jgi:hypothetical protein
MKSQLPWIPALLSLHAATPLAAGADGPGAPAGSGFHTRSLPVGPAGAAPRLQRLDPAATGLTWTNYLSDAKGMENSLLTSGAGVTAGDVDGDGWCDLFFCGLEGRSALFRNLGNWRFEDISAAAGLNFKAAYLTGAALADVDGDGDLDLLVNATGRGTRLFLNDGKGHFTEARDSVLVQRFGATGIALADVDGNGTLDLYVANYATTKIEDRPNARFETKTVDGKLIITAIDGVSTSTPELANRYFVDAEKIVRELGEPDILYLNDGKGHFRQASWTDGTFLDEQGRPLKLPPYDFGLSVMFHDINGDGAPDIYVCNDLFPPDRIWINDGKGHFRAMSNLALRNTSRFSMGVDFADINRDGIDDFFVVDMLSRDHRRRKVQTVGIPSMTLPVGRVDDRPQYRRNTLFLGRGDGTYAEIGQYSGLNATEWSWMPLFIDLDLDGYEDVLVSTGYYRDSLNADAVGKILEARRGRKLTDQEQRDIKQRFYPPLRLPNQAFRNRGDLTFEDMGEAWGFNFVGMSQGMCLADLDNDGDLDVVVNHLNDAAGLYRNEATAPRISVRLKGSRGNTRGIGARIRVTGASVPQSQEMICGGRYLSSDDAIRMFAAPAQGKVNIEVTWRGGARSRVAGVAPNQDVLIEESAAVAEPPVPPARADTLFEDVSPLIHHQHIDARFEDFERQPQLPRKLSQLGPGVTWCDIDGDGWDDLVVGSGSAGLTAIFRNNQKGGFERLRGDMLSQTNARDQTCILSWDRADGRRVLLAGTSNYEDGAAEGSMVRELVLADQKIGDNLPAWEVTVGPIALADLDGDGQLDLFVGGRVVPGRYPENPSSLMFHGDGRTFSVDKDNCRKLGGSGMVSGAVFSDLNGDGLPDLVLACEWGPVRVYRNEGGKLREVTRDLGLDKFAGLWNGVSTGDFDGDGQMDILASNYGRNTRYQAYRAQPLRVYFGEWSGRGTMDVLESYFDPALRQWVPWCTFDVARTLPWVIEQYPTHESFSTAGVAEILGDRTKATRMLQATWLETTLFLNRGDHFEARVLPQEAQFAPAFGVAIADLDGNRTEDVFLSQNFFAVDGDTPRYDAGRGLVLLGDGKGGFQSVPGQQSGVMLYGEQRGAAASDWDGDGRVDLAVAQNGSTTTLLHNRKAHPGLRVRLAGPPGNPRGIGAVMRLGGPEGPGPARELHAGAGYWSQDSAVQVLAASPGARKLWIRWPGGKETTVDIPQGAAEIAVDPGGKVTQSR